VPNPLVVINSARVVGEDASDNSPVAPAKKAAKH
jgi:hypothetical protein